MSLEIPSTEDLINDHSLRWQKVCLDYNIWEIPKIINRNCYADWTELKFGSLSLPLLDELDNQEGIYMFVVKPKESFTKYHSTILYIGETKNLKQRYIQYLGYKTSTHPSDQKKRMMTVVWEEYLYFNYFKTDYKVTSARRKEEYDLIDSIVPPINDDFRADALKTHIKLYRK